MKRRKMTMTKMTKMTKKRTEDMTFQEEQERWRQLSEGMRQLAGEVSVLESMLGSEIEEIDLAYVSNRIGEYEPNYKAILSSLIDIAITIKAKL